MSFTLGRQTNWREGRFIAFHLVHDITPPATAWLDGNRDGFWRPLTGYICKAMGLAGTLEGEKLEKLKYHRMHRITTIFQRFRNGKFQFEHPPRTPPASIHPLSPVVVVHLLLLLLLLQFNNFHKTIWTGNGRGFSIFQRGEKEGHFSFPTKCVDGQIFRCLPAYTWQNSHPARQLHCNEGSVVGG